MNTQRETINKEQLKADFIDALSEKYDIAPHQAEPYQLHDAISSAIMKQIAFNWRQSRYAHLAARRACYFSAEFLVGRAIYNNMLCLEIQNDVEDIFRSVNADINSLEEIEDAALGNGGLGRLAACFLDSAATLSLPLDGYGIRYKYGLFKQTIEDGFQKEQADDWTKYGDAWSKRREEDAVTVCFADQQVKAVPYDMPIIGFKTDNIGTLRLWQAEPINKFDFIKFNDQDYINASIEQIRAEDISRVLYPNDDTREGKILRLKQQYFFCAASLADIVKKHKACGNDIHTLADKVTVQLNDTHPVISIPELIRILTDNEGLSFEEAFEIVKKVFNYTNHTIMAEAMEKWDTGIVEQVLPRIYDIILQLNEVFIADMYRKGLPRATIDSMKLISGGLVHMAKMAIYCSSYTNGVAALHTEILKNDTLNDWYKLYPERFQNKTNGITPRRWIALCNKELSSLITEQLGDDDWINDLSRLEKLEKLRGDNGMMQRFLDIKQQKKRALAEYILKNEGVDIDPNSIFDIQIKRLHEYKRQLLNAFSILYIYFGIKDGSIKDLYPTTFIFGAKSAPGYRRAKAIIKYINEIGRLINGDEQVKDLIKVVFVQNYNVSYAEKLVTAADISEQISTAGTEASGTGNMKFMLNGTVTLGTYDGANVEIVEEAGEDNNYIFGARVEELGEIMKNYDPRKLIADDPKIARVLNTLIDGTVSDGGSGDFRELYFALTDGASWHVPDHYYLIGDLDSYVKAKLKANADYKNARLDFARKCWANMCYSGKFSSDRTIKDYAENIWKIAPVEV